MAEITAYRARTFQIYMWVWGPKIPISVHLFGKSVTDSRPNISTTRGVVTENSSDSSSGRRPESKSDEFSVTTPLGVEIISILVRDCTEIMLPLIGIRGPVRTACALQLQYRTVQVTTVLQPAVVGNSNLPLTEGFRTLSGINGVTHTTVVRRPEARTVQVYDCTTLRLHCVRGLSHQSTR